MAKVTVKVIGVDKFVRDQQSFIKNLSTRQVKEIAQETAVIMKEKIQQSITRANSSGNLANTINAEEIRRGCWGVGNIPLLNEQAPYWRHVNFGSEAIGASHSHRVPTGGFVPGSPVPTQGATGSRWTLGQGSFSFIPTRPIAPLNYIAKTVQEIPRIAEGVLRRG